MSPSKKPGIGVMIALKPGAGSPPRYKATPDLPGTPKDADPDAGRPEQDVTISPEAVDYHDSSEACHACEYLAAGDHCRVLKMHVDPQGHCEAYENKADDADSQPEPEGMY